MSKSTKGHQMLAELEKRVAELERKVREFENRKPPTDAVSRAAIGKALLHGSSNA